MAVLVKNLLMEPTLNFVSTVFAVDDAASARPHALASNVFEHLADRHELFECLEGCWRVLKPGGKMIIMQPNYAAVKEKFYDFADHSLPLTEKGMAEALESNGFTIVYSKARFIPYTTKSRYPRSPFLVRVYLRIPLAHWIFGGQMFFVATKALGATPPSRD